MQRRFLQFLCLVPALTFILTVVTSAGGGAPATTAPNAQRAARGEYLVKFGLCNDCHTPLKMGANGPEPDMAHMLSGHPADLRMPPAPRMQGLWAWAGAATNTAFAGPWGVSYTANLTPDKETGLGNWTEDMFMQALRTGRHEGKGRPILPPMPYQWVSTLNDEDLRSVFAYLQSIPAVRNKVPAPADPVEEPTR